MFTLGDSAAARPRGQPDTRKKTRRHALEARWQTEANLDCMGGRIDHRQDLNLRRTEQAGQARQLKLDQAGVTHRGCDALRHRRCHPKCRRVMHRDQCAARHGHVAQGDRHVADHAGIRRIDDKKARLRPGHTGLRPLRLDLRLRGLPLRLRAV